MFTLDSDGRLVDKINDMCLKADGWLWPKLRTCSNNDSQMIWNYLDGSFVTNGGTHCLTFDPSWSVIRLKVDLCDDGSGQDWSWNELSSSVVRMLFEFYIPILFIYYLLNSVTD